MQLFILGGRPSAAWKQFHFRTTNYFQWWRWWWWSRWDSSWSSCRVTGSDHNSSSGDLCGLVLSVSVATCYVDIAYNKDYRCTPYVLVIAWVAVKFGINITSVVLEMGINFTRRSRVKFTISNTTRVVFIPNFTATHAIPS